MADLQDMNIDLHKGTKIMEKYNAETISAPFEHAKIADAILKAAGSEAAQILTIRESIRFAQEAIKQLKEIGE